MSSRQHAIPLSGGLPKDHRCHLAKQAKMPYLSCLLGGMMMMMMIGMIVRDNKSSREEQVRWTAR